MNSKEEKSESRGKKTSHKTHSGRHHRNPKADEGKKDSSRRTRNPDAKKEGEHHHDKRKGEKSKNEKSRSHKHNHEENTRTHSKRKKHVEPQSNLPNKTNDTRTHKSHSNNPELQVSVKEDAWQALQTAIGCMESGFFQDAIPHLQYAISTLITPEDGYNSFREEIKFAALYYQTIHLIIEGFRYRNSEMYEQFGLVLARIANIPILPEHRMVIMRQALKANFILGNFHTCAGFLNLLLQVENEILPHETLRKMLDRCQQEGFVETHNAAGDLTRPLPMCFQTGRLIKNPIVQYCSLCGATFYPELQLTQCGFCVSSLQSASFK